MAVALAVYASVVVAVALAVAVSVVEALALAVVVAEVVTGIIIQLIIILCKTPVIMRKIRSIHRNKGTDLNMNKRIHRL